MTVNVDGIVKASLHGSPWEVFDFGFPKPMTLYPGDNGMDVSFRLNAPVTDLLPVPISVKSVNLTRIDERMDGQHSVVHEVSTIMSGNLRIDATNGTRRLTKGEKILVDQPVGKIQEIKLAADHVAVRFEGKARNVVTCAEEVCKDLRPTLARWLWNQHRVLALVVGAGFLAVLGVLMYLSSSG